MKKQHLSTEIAKLLVNLCLLLLYAVVGDWGVVPMGKLFRQQKHWCNFKRLWLKLSTMQYLYKAMIVVHRNGTTS